MPGGRFVATGTYVPLGRPGDFAAVRFLPDGSPDTSFGPGGISPRRFPDDYDVPSDATISPDGTVVLAGTVSFGTEGHGMDWALVRFGPEIPST